MENCNNISSCMQGTMSRNYPGHHMKTYNHNHSACTSDDTRYDFPIGMTYVPWQKWRDIYEPDKALQRGTMFAELDKPFYGASGVKR